MDNEIFRSNKYYWIDTFREGLAAIQLNRKWGFIDTSGREICPIKYDWAYDFSKGLAQVELNKKYGVINSQGKEIIPLIFNNIEFVGSVIIATLNRQYGVIDNNGEYILLCIYDDIDINDGVGINDGVIVARKSNRIYEFNQSGELVNIFCN